LRYYILESKEMKCVLDRLQRLSEEDTPISEKAMDELRKSAAELFNNFLGIVDVTIDDEYIWFYEECCEQFEKILNSKLWAFEISQIDDVNLLNVRGDLVLKIKCGVTKKCQD